MREILFRGKRIDNGEWEYGNLNYGTIEIKSIKDSYYISDFDVNPWDKKFYPVIPESVGQYTGMTDKNGNEIFEGDIVKFPHGTKSINGKIEYIEEDCIYYLTYKTGRVPFGVFFNGFELEIIGNIYDNSELLEVTK